MGVRGFSPCPVPKTKRQAASGYNAIRIPGLCVADTEADNK
jgi:hypothetical protein